MTGDFKDEKPTLKNGKPNPKYRYENTLRYHETSFPDPNVEEWRGVTVFGEFQCGGELHPLTWELLGKAREMAEQPQLHQTLMQY